MVPWVSIYEYLCVKKWGWVGYRNHFTQAGFMVEILKHWSFILPHFQSFIKRLIHSFKIIGTHFSSKTREYCIFQTLAVLSLEFTTIPTNHWNHDLFKSVTVNNSISFFSIFVMNFSHEKFFIQGHVTKSKQNYFYSEKSRFGLRSVSWLSHSWMAQWISPPHTLNWIMDNRINHFFVINIACPIIPQPYTKKSWIIESFGYCYHFYDGPKWSY